jgi:broad specificity phosphatase PhoE
MPPGKSEDFRRIVLVRHGESTANRDRVLTGRIDPLLTRRGRRQAHRAARYIDRRIGNVNLVFSSPLQRSLDTAQTIAGRLNLAIARDDLLLETDFGAWEGLSIHELASAPEWERYTLDPFHFTFPGGESPQQVRSRVHHFLHGLLNRDDWSTAVVVTHYTPLAFFVLHVLGGIDGKRAPFAIDNASITVLRISENSGYLELLNYTP